MRETGYRREVVLQYARQWAMGKNPRYLDFEKLGGDCTNFASQCIYAGSGVMNYTPVMGWYYNSSSDRSPSWTGVQPGDIVQLGNRNGYYHSPVIVAVEGGRIFVAAHSFDAYMHPLDSYIYEKSRFLHIQGARNW